METKCFVTKTNTTIAKGQLAVANNEDMGYIMKK